MRLDDIVTPECKDTHIPRSLMLTGPADTVYGGTVLESGMDEYDMVLLDLAPDQDIPAHHHETCEEMALVLRGSGEIREGEETVSMNVHDLVQLRRSRSHHISAGPDGLRLLVFHAPPMLDRIDD